MSKQSSAPHPSTAETWFGPKSPDVTKFDSPVNVMSPAVIVPCDAIAATATQGNTADHRTFPASACVARSCRNSITAQAIATGPARSNDSASRASPSGRVKIVIAADGTNTAKNSNGTPIRRGRRRSGRGCRPR